MSYQEIAKKYGVSEATARRRIQRAQVAPAIKVKKTAQGQAREYHDYRLDSVAPLFRKAKK